jgi:hypothetical protein
MKLLTKQKKIIKNKKFKIKREKETSSHTQTLYKKKLHNE